MSRNHRYLFLALSACVVLFQLQTAPIYQWDESRLAINALEMYHNGYSWVTTYLGQPDHWNTKPPLMIWLQVSAMHLFGPTEFALRLPAALAILGTVWILLAFLEQQKAPHPWPLLAAGVLLLTPGIMRYHVARTGDYDALLVLWTTAGSLTYYRALHQENRTLIFWALFLFSMGALTKGIAGFLVGPALLGYTLYQKKLRWVLGSYQTWLGVLALFGLPVLYYIIREAQDSGYLDAMLHEEITGRYGQVVAGYGGGPAYYLEVFMDYRQYSYWMLLFLPGVYLGLRNKNSRKVVGFLGIVVLTTLLVLTMAKTKFNWYNAILYPFMAPITAFTLYQIYQKIGEKRKTLAGFAVGLLFLYPAIVVVEENYLHIRVIEEQPLGYHLQQLTKENNSTPFFLIKEDPRKREWSHFNFYLRREALAGHETGIITPSQITPGMRIAVQQADTALLNATPYPLQLEAKDQILVTYTVLP